MLIDLHTHSVRSDGTTTPSEVVRAARGAGVDVLALTDHDTTTGWDEATRAAEEVGLTLVRGLEISCAYRGRAVHLLAYLPDPTYRPLLEALDLVLEGRDDRMPRIVGRLKEVGVPIEESDVLAEAAGAAAIGRPHIADALVRLGVVADRDEAFGRFLSPGRPGHVSRYAAPLDDMLGHVSDAGGVSVIAHPWGRTGPASLPAEVIADLAARGLTGLEVDHQDHDAAARSALRGIAGDLDLVVTGSSDFHGAGKVDHELACNTTDPDQFARLVDLAGEAARAASRRTPEVVGL